MLGFNAISEVSIAELPGAFVPVSGQVGTSALGSVGITAVGGLSGNTYVDEQKTGVLVPGEERSVICQPGDGVIYKGCERPHWRNSMPFPKQRKRDILLRRPQKEYYYHQIFFHYVLQDGIRAHFAHDSGN